MANELKSLTLNGKKYDSFIDQATREIISDLMDSINLENVLTKEDIVQEAGQSESLVMSQKTVTEQFAQVSEAIADKVSTAPQTLTEAQKAQARANIGAASAEAIESLKALLVDRNEVEY